VEFAPVNLRFSKSLKIFATRIDGLLSLEARFACPLSTSMSAQAADLREFARAVAVGAGTIQIEKHIRDLEFRRVELHQQFEQAALDLPSPGGE
jgi:hypothetical protein